MNMDVEPAGRNIVDLVNQAARLVRLCFNNLPQLAVAGTNTGGKLSDLINIKLINLFL